MSDWGAGYITDIEYLPGFYREQAPAHMALACLLGGVAPPDLGGAFSYCDLGCGAGRTAMTLAAANPAAAFYGVDFHPAHIARARRLAQRAGLDNATFIEAGFADLADGDGGALPAFDVVALHGVYAWISPDNRKALVRLLARIVKPGGMVYVSYNSLPGWTPLAPLQRLLLENAALTHGAATEKIAAGIDFALKLRAAGADILGEADAIKQLRAVGPTENDDEKLAYLAHEYLNAHWSPLYHADVARDMAAAKLTYAGSATLLENFPALSLTQEQHALLATVADPALRETFKDYCARRPFRRDVFVRGAQRLTPAERDRRLSALRLALTVSHGERRATVKAPLGEAELPAWRYEPIFAALADGPKSVAELARLSDAPGVPPANPAELVGLLTGSGQAMLATADLSAAAGGAASRFNRLCVDDALTEMTRKTVALATPLCGGGLHLSLAEALLYDAAANGAITGDAAGGEAAEQATTHALRRLTGLAEPPPDHPNRPALLESMVWGVAESLPLWRRLGMI